MAKNRIKGITIEIGGDTTQLQQSLKQVDSALKNTQNSLKDVNRLLKLDPKNTELLRQKQELLNTAVRDTKDRLTTLKDAYRQLDGKGTEEAKEQQKLLAREIAETEQNLKSLKAESRDFGSVFKQQLQAVGQELKDVGDKLSSTGKDLSMKLTAPLLAVGGVGIAYNAQLEQYQTMFTTLTGSAEEADKIITQLQEDASKSPFDTASLIEANQYLISAGVEADEARTMINNLGNAVAATGGGSAELSRMAQNLQQIKNTGKATAMDIRQFANAGINIYGLLSEATGKTVAEVQEMDVSYELLSDALAKASAEGGKYYGAMEAQSQTLNGSLSSLKDSISQLLGSITEAAMPVIKRVLQYVKDLVDRFKNLDDNTKNIILTVGAVLAAIGPALIIIGKVIGGIGSIISAVGSIGGALSTLYGWLSGTLLPWLTGTLVPWITGTLLPILTNPVVLAIMGIITAGVLLYKNWDTIKQKASELVNNIKTKFDDIKNSIVNKINSAKDAVKSAIDKIKSFFNFNWSLPKLKLPHISISGGFSLVPPKAPKFSIDWYSKAMKNGMILNNPTIFGAMNGKLLGAGEAGSETIVGTNSLMNMIKQASSGMTVNMTINAQDQNVYQLADLVIDRLVATTRAERNVFR